MIRRLSNKVTNKFYNNKKSSEIERTHKFYEAIKARDAHNYMVYLAGGGLIGTLNILENVLIQYDNLNEDIEDVEERLNMVMGKVYNNTEIENLENIVIKQQIDIQINKPEIKIKII